jgi:hypothetical protein
MEEAPVAEVNETAQRQCDRCGALSEPAPKGTVPDGWLTGLGLRVPGGFEVFSDLDPVCAGLPVAQAVVPVPAQEPAA